MSSLGGAKEPPTHTHTKCCDKDSSLESEHDGNLSWPCWLTCQMPLSSPAWRYHCSLPLPAKRSFVFLLIAACLRQQQVEGRGKMEEGGKGWKERRGEGRRMEERMAMLWGLEGLQAMKGGSCLGAGILPAKSILLNCLAQAILSGGAATSHQPLELTSTWAGWLSTWASKQPRMLCLCTAGAEMQAWAGGGGRHLMWVYSLQEDFLGAVPISPSISSSAL